MYTRESLLGSICLPQRLTNGPILPLGQRQSAALNAIRDASAFKANPGGGRDRTEDSQPGKIQVATVMSATFAQDYLLRSKNLADKATKTLGTSLNTQ